MALWSDPFRTRPDHWALEAQVALAGCALACHYSGSDEYEAAVIAARRAAAAQHARRHAWLAGVAAAALFCIVIAV